jgi:hypothetical protein
MKGTILAAVAAVACAAGVCTFTLFGKQHRIDATSLPAMKASLKVVREDLKPARRQEFDAAMESVLMQSLRDGGQRELAEVKKAYKADPESVFLRLCKPILHGRTADEVIAQSRGETTPRAR